MYDRQFYSSAASAQDGALLLARVCFLSIGAVLCTGAGALVTMLVPSPGLMLVGVIGMFVMLFVCRAVADRYPVNIAALVVFAALEGLAMGPALLMYARLNDGPMVIVQAALLTVVIFGIVGTLGYTSTRSYAQWLPWLMGALIAMLIGGLILWFIAAPAAHWLYSVAGAVLFIAFIFVDFTRIRHDFGPQDYIVATLEVYLDLINLFWFILRLVGGRRSD